MSEQQRDHETPGTPVDRTAPAGAAPGTSSDRPAPAGGPYPGAGQTPADVDGELVDAVAEDADPGRPAGSQDAQQQAAADADQASADAAASAEPAEPEVEEEPDWKDRYVRSVAELDNVRKRSRRDVAQAESRGVSRLAKELLPALDNLDRALAHVDSEPADQDRPSAGDAQLVEGLRIVHREIHAALSAAGITAYDPIGEPFDPHAHEALTQQPAPEGTLPGTILAVYQAGYRRGDDVLRAAKVVVAG